MYILSDNERICTNCGKVFDDSFPYRFCPECGKELKKANEYLDEENAEFETSAGICLFCYIKLKNLLAPLYTCLCDCMHKFISMHLFIFLVLSFALAKAICFNDYWCHF